ncbi:MAG TPA: ornithine cyclodeaminase family protein [Chloroflexota bacterium]|jgi:ornithine cyclodeaminase/alanine dehydrogenase-like protein (mu-crystallin family)|nr:ornithine cyclodeaminase family protein [Chloroflexota bacterium]
MTLLLREPDVRDLLPMKQAVRLVREAMSSGQPAEAVNLPRRRVPLQSGVLNLMAASVSFNHTAGLKAYTAGRSGAHFLVAIWDRDEGRLLSLIEADLLGRIRTGAASGVATDALASPNASVLAIIGSGRQARTQLEAIAAVRHLTEVRVFSRSPERCRSFAEAAGRELDLNVMAAESAESAVAGSQIVTTITTSAKPVLFGRWLETNVHVNAAGSNWAHRREVDTELISRASTIAVDSIEQAKLEAGDLLIPIEQAALSWDRVIELGTVLGDPTSRPASPGGITFFKSLGIAVEDLAVARFVYDRAVEMGIGEQTTFGDAS